MRKPFFIAAVIAMAAGVGAIYWSLSIAPSIISELSDSKRFIEVNPAVKKPAEKSSVANSNANPTYRGQALNYLGDPQALVKYPKEFVGAYRQRLETAINLAVQYPKDENYWIEIGIVKKNLDNYFGARDAWEYASLLNSENATVYYNLANLYGLYLGDLKRAEENYKKSIETYPYTAQSYLALSDFYKDVYTEKSDLTDNVLLEGLRQIPGDPNLILGLAIYYKSSGDKENAIKYFEQFLTLKNLSKAQIQAVQKELDSLRSL